MATYYLQLLKITVPLYGIQTQGQDWALMVHNWRQDYYHGYYSNYCINTIIFIGYHKGAVWDLDCSWDTGYLLTACGDGSARLFVATSGEYVARMPHNGWDKII